MNELFEQIFEKKTDNIYLSAYQIGLLKVIESGKSEELFLEQAKNVLNEGIIVGNTSYRFDDVTIKKEVEKPKKIIEEQTFKTESQLSKYKENYDKGIETDNDTSVIVACLKEIKEDNTVYNSLQDNITKKDGTTFDEKAFVVSVINQYIIKGYLTEKQLNVAVRIVKKVLKIR